MSFTSGENNERHLHSFNSMDDLEAIFRKWYPSLCHSTFRIIKDKDRAEDIVQDIFVRMWENRKDIEITISVKSYLFRACINAALNEISRQRKNLHVSSENELIIDPGNTGDNIDREDLQRKIDEGLNLLPPACKSVFILSRFEEMSYKEIAETLDISIKTVENQMGKALKILREYLKDYLIPVIVLLLYN